MTNNALAVLDIEIVNQGDPVKTSLACAQLIQKSALPSLRQALKRAHKQKDDLLGCEEELASKINLCINSLTRRIKVIEEYELAKRYQYFDIQTALSFRDEDGLPSLAIYSINSGICSFENTTYDSGKFQLNGIIGTHRSNTAYSISMEPLIPKWLEETYTDFAILLSRLKQGTKFVSKLKGHIPSQVRAQIADVKNDFDHIFIITEACWEKTAIPYNSMAVGLKNTHAWLIATFEPNSLEVKINNALTTEVKED